MSDPPTEEVGKNALQDSEGEAAPESDPEAGGFGHSQNRIITEIAVAVGGIVLLILLVVGGARLAAGHLVGFISTDLDVSLGEQAWKAGALGGTECPNEAAQKYIEQLAKPLVESLEDSPFEYHFRVVDTEVVNAFALPGGFVTVNRGLIEKAESGEEIAAVLAHELQHVERRHGTKRVLREIGGAMVLWTIFGGTDIQAPALLLGEALGMKYDRDQETESDTLGLELMKRAKIDPSGMATFFKRLEEESALAPPELLSTHPDPGNRAERAREAAGEGGSYEKLPAPGGVACK